VIIVTTEHGGGDSNQVIFMPKGHLAWRNRQEWLHLWQRALGCLEAGG